MCMHSYPVRKRYYKGKPTKDYLMSQVSPLSKNFYKWLDKVVFKDRHYMFFLKVDKKTHLGECQCCKQRDILLVKPQHKKMGKCPNCGQKVIYYNSKFKSFRYQQHWVCKLQTVKDDLILARYFKATKYTEDSKVDYCYSVCEYERCFYNPKTGELRTFQSRWDYQNKGQKWINGPYCNNWVTSIPSNFKVYTQNLKSISKRFSELRYTQIDRYAVKMECDPIRYFIKCKEYPQIEYFVKRKMHNLVNNILVNYESELKECLNLDAKSFSDVTRVKNKSNLDYILKHNCTARQIRTISILEKIKIKPSPQLVDFYCYVNLRDSIFENVISRTNLFNYYRTVCRREKQVNAWNFFRDYTDYIQACDHLKYDLNDTQIFKPKNFYLMHDRVLALKEQMDNKDLWAKFAKVCKKMRKVYQYSNKKYSVVVPETAIALKDEGKALGHCVGTYINRIVNGYCIVLFVRMTEHLNESFVTMEINPKNLSIVQVRGKGNCDPPSEVKAFVSEWEKKVLVPLRQKTA